MYHASGIRPQYPPAPPIEAPPDEPAGLRTIDFSTNNLAEAERFAAWREIHSATVELSRGKDNGGFSARHRTWDLGHMAFQTVETDGVRFSSLARQGRRDPLDHWVVSIFVSGECMVQGAGGLLRSVPGVPQVTSLADNFHGHQTRGRAHLLYIPRDTCRDSAHIIDASSQTRLQHGMGSIFADYMLSLAHRLEHLQPDDLGELVSATRALLVAAIVNRHDRLDEARPVINHTVLERARQCVQSNLQNPALDVQFILRRLGVSRSRLYRLFEASGGIVHYIQKRRLIAAHNVLADPLNTRRIFEVAEDFCFNDAAEFSRAFRREFSCSPSDVRATARSTDDPHRPPPAYADELSSLLRRL